MDHIRNLYKNLWMSLIKPRRTIYSEEDLGGSMLIFETGYALRLDFHLRNSLNELFYMSIYFPCNEKEEIPKNLTFIVYCHTHNGCRVEGLGLLEKLLRRGIGLVVFDFRANGFSSGNYVTLGWLEAIDINTVCLFLKKEVKASSLILWGRSMGACACIFFMSPAYRKEIDGIMDKRRTRIDWMHQKYIDCLILDSPFSALTKSIQHMVNCKASKVPLWLVDLTVKLIDSDVKKKAGISLYRVNPAAHVSSIKTPVHMIMGNEDELVDSDAFYSMFRSFGSKIKKITMFNGAHADERSDELQIDLLTFIQHILELKKSYLANKESNLDITNLGNVTHNYLNYNQSQLHKNFDQNANRTRLITTHRSYIPVNKNINLVPGGLPDPKNVEEAGKFAEMKKLQLSKAFKFSVKPVNLEDDGNQFDPRQIMNDNEIEFNIDNMAVNDFIKENNVEKADCDALKHQNPQNISGMKNLSIRFIPKMNINERLVSIRSSHRRNIVESKQKFDNSFEEPLFANRNKAPVINSEFQKVPEPQKNPWNSHRDVFVPQYTQSKAPVLSRDDKKILQSQGHQIPNPLNPNINGVSPKKYNLNTSFSKRNDNYTPLRQPTEHKVSQNGHNSPNPLKLGFNRDMSNKDDDYIIVEEKDLKNLDITEGKTIYFDGKGNNKFYNY